MEKKPSWMRPWRKALKTIEVISCQKEGEFEPGKGSANRLLPEMLSMAIPLWMYRYGEWREDDRLAELKRLESSDFCLRMEYVLHKGPEKDDTAKAFNDLAACIALLSFCPGGVRAFGVRYEWVEKKVSVSKS